MTEWQMGMLAFREGRLREAADRLRAASQEHERAISQAVSFQTFAYLGAALYALGQPSPAAEAFTQAIALRLQKKPALDLMINLANAHLAAGHQNAAEKTLTQALRDYPGAMEAQTLQERLHNRKSHEPVKGVILGETPESVKLFLDTLTFSSVPVGYAPDQVRAAISQVEHYIDLLARLLDDQEQTMAMYIAENTRLRQSEETLVENLVQARQEADQLQQVVDSGSQALVQGSNGQPSDPLASTGMTPLEKLFQKKT